METLVPVFGWFFGILVTSLAICIWYRHIKTTILKVLFDIILFIGVTIHECAHACLLLSMRIMPTSFSVRYHSRFTGRASPHGEVGFRSSDELQMSFLQGFLVSLAPLFVSTFLFLFMLDIIYNMNSTDEMKIVAGIVAGSLLLGSAPSGADINTMMMMFKRRPEYSLYQVLIAGISILLVVLYIDISFLVLPFEVLYYILNCFLVIGVYFVLKGTMLITKIVILWIYNSTRSYKENHRNPRRLHFRRKLKPFKPKRKEREEVIW